MEIFLSIVPIICFTLVNSAVSVIFKEGFGKTLPFTFLSSIMLVFFSQVFFQTFKIGLFVIILSSLSSVLYLKKNNDKKEYYLTNGLYVFILLCFIFMFINFGRKFFLDDELGFWGKMVKEMIRMDKFYYLNESTLRGHNDYPPFIPIFEFIWCKLSLGFSECNCSLAMHIYEFGIVVPLLFDGFFKEKKIKEKIMVDFFAVLMIAGFIVFLDAADVFNAIYTDTLIGMEFACSIFLVYSKKEQDTFIRICYVLILSAILMTKQVGIAFCLLSLFYDAVCCIAGKHFKQCLSGLIISAVIPACFFLLWNRLIQPFDIIKQFDLSKISILGFMDILKGNTYQFTAIKLYVNALFKTEIYHLFVPITFMSSLLLEFLFLELLKKISKGNNKKIFIFQLTSIVGTIGYAFMMLILYAFCYPEREAVVLQSYTRYMSSFLTGMFFSILLLYVNELKKSIDTVNLRSAFISLLLVLVVFDGNRLLNFVPQVILGDRFGVYRSLAQKLEKKVESGSMIYILYNHDGTDSYPAFVSYYCDNVYFSKVNIDLYANDYQKKEDYEKAVAELKKHDYMYTVNVSDSFNDYFGSLVSGENYIENRLYRIIKNDDEIRMEIVD